MASYLRFARSRLRFIVPSGAERIMRVFSEKALSGFAVTILVVFSVVFSSDVQRRGRNLVEPGADSSCA